MLGVCQTKTQQRTNKLGSFDDTVFFCKIFLFFSFFFANWKTIYSETRLTIGKVFNKLLRVEKTLKLFFFASFPFLSEIYLVCTRKEHTKQLMARTAWHSWYVNKIHTVLEGTQDRYRWLWNRVNICSIIYFFFFFNRKNVIRAIRYRATSIQPIREIFIDEFPFCSSKRVIVIEWCHSPPVLLN